MLFLIYNITLAHYSRLSYVENGIKLIHNCYFSSGGTTDIDPVSSLELNDIYEFFGKEVICYNIEGSEWNYTEYIIRIKTNKSMPSLIDR